MQVVGRVCVIVDWLKTFCSSGGFGYSWRKEEMAEPVNVVGWSVGMEKRWWWLAFVETDRWTTAVRFFLLDKC